MSLLAYHFLAAGDRASAPRAARYARAAAEQATWRFAHHEAARLWQEAVAAHDRSQVHDERTRLSLIMGMIRALALAGDVVTARERRNAAIADAEKLGDPALTADLLSAFDVPTIWTNRRYAAKDDHVVAAAERVLRLLPPRAEEARCRVLTTLALELDGTQDDRAGRPRTRPRPSLAAWTGRTCWHRPSTPGTRTPTTARGWPANALPSAASCWPSGSATSWPPSRSLAM